jgi:type II secretory pathway component GspD/PulD (secretin)
VTDNRNKVPLLGDIPLLGKAFRQEIHTTAKTEIVIFLTPHIINGDVHVDPGKYLMIKEDKHY